MKTIFITGATGYLGSHFLYHLLHYTDDVIYCLSRSKGYTSAETRINEKLYAIDWSYCKAGINNFGLQDKIKTNLKIVTGDITEENLGIDASFKNITIDEFWHIAASVQFSELNREEVMETNGEGGKNVLKFIIQNNISTLNFVSTAYVAGQKTGNITECIADENFPVNNAYEQSKRLVEKEIIAASIRGKFSYRIFRPSIIVGHSVTFEPDYSNSGLYGFLYLYASLEEKIKLHNNGYLQTKRLQLHGDQSSTLSLIPIDHVVNLLFEIANEERSINQIYHITPSADTSLKKLVEILNSMSDLQVELVATNENYSVNDRLLNRQVKHYKSYLFYKKHFQRRCDVFTEAQYELNDIRLYKLIHNFYRQYKRSKVLSFL